MKQTYSKEKFMKKLLFFIFVLFGVFSVQSLANCTAQVCTCPSGGYVVFGQNCPGSATYYGGIAINPTTRYFYSAWNYQDGKKAEAAALKGCGSNKCISIWASYNYMAIAISEDEKNWGYGYSDNHDSAWNKAVDMCQESGKTCHVALVGYPDEKARYIYWGGIAYNPDTGLTGKTSDELRKIDAENSALQNAGCNNDTNCYFYAFQRSYGAFAKGQSNKIYSATSNKSLRDAEKQAEKKCKDDTGDKQCKALVSTAKKTKK